MAISDKAIKNLPLGNDVQKVITDCFQDWTGAIEWSIDHLPDPPADSSWLDWGISLAGNMLWAVTVFFPPAFEIATAVEVGLAAATAKKAAKLAKVAYASASSATQAASVFGAAIGSSGTQIAGLLRSLGGELRSPEGKKFIHRFMLRQVGPMQQEFVNRADDWAQANLLPHLITQFSLKTKPDPRLDNDDAFREFYNTAVASEELSRYVWEKFVFPIDVAPYDSHKEGLEDFLLVKLQEMADDYEAQWKEYQARERKRREMVSRVGSPVTDAWWKKPRVPLGFHPVFKFDGIPQHVQATYDTNREKIANTVQALNGKG